ncbi:hypothetical protein AK812_SmicGene24783 [Symbiodinium microadriaticum]|uniref:Uncharacterized protein n=1 Tax=Symbiodinium microadriaticum TaxID=2951 RepID=A0A1Q9DDM7_SYMMI|nr:hypothetical protein AK812_SmicGene24783 [Symbiodinium microadriaticum]
MLNIGERDKALDKARPRRRLLTCCNLEAATAWAGASFLQDSMYSGLRRDAVTVPMHLRLLAGELENTGPGAHAPEKSDAFLAAGASVKALWPRQITLISLAGLASWA